MSMNWKENIKNTVKNHQNILAARIGKHINRYSVRRRQIGLVVFGLTIGIFCFLLIMGVIGTDESHVLKVDSISIPKKINSFSMDSMRSLPSKMIDSLESIIKQLYKDQLN